MNIINPISDITERMFYLDYKTQANVFSRLQRNSISNLNGFKRNFDTNESIAGGILTVDLRLYGSRKLELVKAWEPSATEKAPSTINFTRVSYTRNNDISYALLVFDISESFLKNFEENLVYYDSENRTLLDSLQVRLYVGSVNQESITLNNTLISSDYISINSDTERIGILFTDKPGVQQYLADNATISNIKYLIYNYLPKNVNNINEYVPIRLEFYIAPEDLNKLTEKKFGVELPINKIEEIYQIFDLQKQKFSALETTEKKSIYLNYIGMPITSSDVVNNSSNYFDVYNSFHSIEFNTLFNYNKSIVNGVPNYDFFKSGVYVYEKKPELVVKDALPNRIRLAKNWEGFESSLSYLGFYENRSIYNIFWEISGFFKHLTWLFNEENSLNRNIVITRQTYLVKLQKILLNMLFEKPSQSENLYTYYQKETNYRTFFGSTYNYDQYSGEVLSDLERMFLNITVRNYLMLVDVLWFANRQPSSKQYENVRHYQYLDSHVFGGVKYYNQYAIPKLESFSPIELEKSIEMFSSYLISIYFLYFTENYLNFYNLNNYLKNGVSVSSHIEFNRKLLFYFNENLLNIKIFNPNTVTSENELFLNNKYKEYATFLVLLEEFLNSPVEKPNFYDQKIPRATSNYQFWHIIEKDFALHSAKIGDSRVIMKDTTETDISVMLNNIDIISTMSYGFLDSITSYSGSGISLKTRIVTNL